MTSVDRIVAYLEQCGVKKSAFYANTGLSNGYLDKVKVLGADKIESIISAYPDINLHWLITGKGDMVGSKVKKTATETHFLTKNIEANNLGAPRVITVDYSSNENVVYVPVKARAGYLLGYGDAEYVASLSAYRLPGLTNATYRMFEVDGPSMAPNIMAGDKVIGEWVDQLERIRDNRVYIVVSGEGVVIKRVLNRVKDRGKLVLKSDTINHRREYPTYELDIAEVKELWYCRLNLSSDFSEPAEVYHRIADLEAEATSMRSDITKLFELVRG
jgi:phage repressor protein C with HTH and peptisase S24 domain